MTIPAQRLLDVRRLWVEPAALDSDRGRQVRARFPDAEVIEVASHWQIPELHGNEGNLQRWVRVKSEDLVVGTKKSIATRVNGRSADFIAPSTSNGCAMACVYCYVPRRKGYANPITVFTNIDAIIAHLRRHVAKQGVKPAANQCDPAAWVYDLGENSDCSVDALVSDNVTDLIAAFREMPTAKASFATKYVNRDLLSADPQGRTRIRFSLMPHADARQLGSSTSAPPRSRSGSPRSTFSWPPGTRCTSTFRRWCCGPGGSRTGRSCSAGSTTSCQMRSRRKPPAK